MLRSPHRKQPSAWFTLGTLNIKSPNEISINNQMIFPQTAKNFLKHLHMSIKSSIFAAEMVAKQPPFKQYLLNL